MQAGALHRTRSLLLMLRPTIAVAGRYNSRCSSLSCRSLPPALLDRRLRHKGFTAGVRQTAIAEIPEEIEGQHSSDLLSNRSNRLKPAGVALWKSVA